MTNSNLDRKQKFIKYLLILMLPVVVVMYFTYLNRMSFKLGDKKISYIGRTENIIEFKDEDNKPIKVELMGNKNFISFAEYYRVEYGDLEIVSDSRNILEEKWTITSNGSEISPYINPNNYSGNEKISLEIILGIEEVLKFKENNIPLTSFIISGVIISMGLGLVLLPNSKVFNHLVGNGDLSKSESLCRVNTYIGIILIIIGLFFYPIIM